ncbi:MAG: YfhO family protein [Oscillospiraceae bacterium]|nr:YfhO family protein [Oscillospiraceae bacterium]
MSKAKKTETQAVQTPPPGGGIMGWLRRNASYILAFFLPVALLYIAYAIFGLYPYGDHSVLCLDLNGQYVYYFEAIRDAFHGNGSILYNWERNLSGGFQGVIGYYLASPFTLIVILLPRTMLLGALFIMILCKLGAASVAFCYYAQKSKHVKPMMAVVLGSCFGMCAYGVIQTIDPMWLDGLVCLPFIMLGVEYLVDDGRKLNYIIPLALICIANFYIGFMCCIFTALYFLFYVLAGSDKMRLSSPEWWSKKANQTAVFNMLGRMVISTLVAMACAAFMILPVYNALALGKFDFTVPDYSYKSQFTLLEFIAQFCVNQYNSVNVEGKPEVYAGLLSFLCVPLFFANSRIPLRKKIGYGALTVGMYLCMMIRPIDMLWHGGQMPNWLPFRYSFIFSFIILSMTAMTLRYASYIKKWAIGATYAVYFVLLMIIQKKQYLNMKGEVYLDPIKSIACTLIFLAFYCVVVYLLGKKNPSKGMTATIMACLLTVVSVELTYNAKCEFEDIHTEVAYSTRKSYREYVASGREMVDRLEEYDNSFYRAEKTYVRTVNDNAGFGLRGMTHSSSVMNANILKFIEAMGYCSSTYYSRYDGNTPLSDSMLGIKYVFDKGDANTNVLKKGDNSEIGAAYEKVYTDHAVSQSEEGMTVDVYQNKNALALGFMASKDITRINAFGNDNPFNSQNLLLSTASGQTTFTEGGGFADWHKYWKQISVTEPYRLNQVYTDAYGSQTNFREIKKEDGSHADDPTVDLFITTETDEPLYMFFKTENQSKVNLWLSDQWNEDPNYMLNQDGTAAKSLGSYFEGDNYKILYIGQYPAGQQLQLRMTLLTDQAGTKEKYTIIKDFFFSHFDSEMFENDIQILKQNEWQLTTYGGRTLEGKITAGENQIMMTSIPAEPGWKVWVDGKPYSINVTTDGKTTTANYNTLFQAMIGVELTPGEHTVKMKYTPPGLNAGWFMLICGLFCCYLFYSYDKEHNAVLLLMAKNRKNGIYELPVEEEPEPVRKTSGSRAAADSAAEAKEKMEGKLIADELKKLKELLDDGVLTKEEFDEQKKKLLKK